VFVNLPAEDTVCRGYEYPFKKRLLKAVAELGMPMIDLEPPLRSFVKRYAYMPLFSEWPCGGHFSETGYAVLYETLRDYLQNMTHD
jgi:hypothetical protein